MRVIRLHYARTNVYTAYRMLCNHFRYESHYCPLERIRSRDSVHLIKMYLIIPDRYSHECTIIIVLHVPRYTLFFLVFHTQLKGHYSNTTTAHLAPSIIVTFALAQYQSLRSHDPLTTPTHTGCHRSNGEEDIRHVCCGQDGAT